MPSVAIESSTQTPKKGARIPRGNKPDKAFERAKKLAMRRGLISEGAAAKMKKPERD